MASAKRATRRRAARPVPEGNGQAAAAPSAPERGRIVVTISEDRAFGVEAAGVSPLEVPTALRLAASMFEKKLGVPG